VIKEIISFLVRKDISPFLNSKKIKRREFISHLKKEEFLFKNSYNLREEDK